jgi:hypothetical protein
LIRFEHRSWKSPTPRGTPGLLPKILSRTWFAPAANIEDNRDNAMAKDIAAGTAIEPLDTIALPREALSYEGLYPSDPGDKLTEQVVLILSGA